jgi:hypothetical protein
MGGKSSLSVIILFLFVCLNIQIARAQKLDWVRTTDSYSKQGSMIARDANDNVVSCGYLIHDRITSFSTFTTVFNTTTGSGGNQTISLSGAPRTERYIRLYMTKVNSGYYAVNEFEICGFLSSALKSQNFGNLGITESAIQAPNSHEKVGIFEPYLN